jgi:GTPase
VHCGLIAVIGGPNAGKSTLVNALVGSKVAIVSPKVQTTRMIVRGVAIRADTQIVFVDTPGIFKPRRRLDRAMVRAAWSGAYDADAILLLVDAADLSENPDGRGAADTKAIITSLTGKGHVVALVLNKVDVMRREALLPLTQQLNSSDIFERVFMISALKGDGLNEIEAWCATKCPEGPWLFPEDQAADMPVRLLAAEITREQVYLRLHEELPYESHVETLNWQERKDGSVRIEQVLYVRREGQRAIALGKNGQTIKQIGARARGELEKILGRRLHLFLTVKVSEDWPDAHEHYRALGLEYPKD